MYLHNYSANTNGLTNGNKKVTAKKLVKETNNALSTVGATFLSNRGTSPRKAELNRVYVNITDNYISGNKAPTFDSLIEDIDITSMGRTTYINVKDLDELVGALIHVRDELRTLRDIYNSKAQNLASPEEVESEDNDNDDDYDY